MTLVQIIIVCGLIFGAFFSLVAWANRRNRERTETDRLMREYLEKKLREEQKDE